MLTGDDLLRRTQQHAETIAQLADGGHRLGMNVWIGRREQTRRTREGLLVDRLDEREQRAYLGGIARAAEELALGHTTTGAANDIQRATDLARKMVCEWGMSEELGPITFHAPEENVFLGRDFAQTSTVSESTSREIDAAVRKLICAASHRARSILESNLAALHGIAASLLEPSPWPGRVMMAPLLAAERPKCRQ